MGALYRKDDPFMQAAQCAAARERELADPQPGSLQYASYYELVRGNCQGCNAPYAYSPLQNINAKGAGECQYCGRSYFGLQHLLGAAR